MKSLVEAKVGQRLSFAYFGGSTPGAIREVDVEEVRDDRIVGVDVAKQKTRQYLADKAALIQVVSEPAVVTPPLAAEAACDVETVRVRRTTMSFLDARQRLHDQIDALNGEDLAEVLAEVDGQDRAVFDASNGVVVLEREVLIPHAEVNDNAHREAAGIDWVNEDGDRLTTTFFHDGDKVRLFNGDNEVDAESLVSAIARHIGLNVQ